MSLSDSANRDLLPKLQHISFAFSDMDENPQLPELNKLTSLEWPDVPIKINHITRLSSLDSLSISAGHISLRFGKMFCQMLSQLTNLTVYDVRVEHNQIPLKILKAEHLKKIEVSDAFGKFD